MATKKPKIKSADKGEFAVVWALLRAVRIQAKLSQKELSDRLGRTQTFVSDVEIGRRRLDALQLYEWCHGCGASLATYAQNLEAALDVLPSNLPKVVREKRPRTAVAVVKTVPVKKAAPRKAAMPKK